LGLGGRMKYKVGDLINNKWGNVDKLGYIIKVCERSEYLAIVFFQSSDVQHTFSFYGFERYYKVL
jgi:hypothetical protein